MSTPTDTSFTSSDQDFGFPFELEEIYNESCVPEEKLPEFTPEPITHLAGDELEKYLQGFKGVLGTKPQVNVEGFVPLSTWDMADILRTDFLSGQPVDETSVRLKLIKTAMERQESRWFAKREHADTLRGLVLSCAYGAAHLVGLHQDRSYNYADVVLAGTPGLSPSDPQVIKYSYGFMNVYMRAKPKGFKPSDLGVVDVVAVVNATTPLVLVDEDLITYYEEDESSDAYGLHVRAEPQIYRMAQLLGIRLGRAALADYHDSMISTLPKVEQDKTRSAVVLANGIWDYDKQVLEPFSRDRVFLSKSVVRWNPTATNPVIKMPDGETWDIESWMSDLANDSEDLTTLFWQSLGAVLRPRAGWKKMLILHGTGRNGKGTLLQLMRNLVGEGRYANANLEDLGRPFGMAAILPQRGVVPSLVCADENGDPYVKQIDKVKAMITGDGVSVECKNKDVISFRWQGVLVQCMNELLTTSESNESITHRLLTIPFVKEFGEVNSGKTFDRKYIKLDYIARQDVLEYVVRRVLDHSMTEAYDTFIECAETDALLETQKELNDPITAFWREMSVELALDFVPVAMAHDMYQAWLKRAMPSSRPIGRTKFVQAMSTKVLSMGWEYRKGIRSGSSLNRDEPVLFHLGLSDTWLEADRVNSNIKWELANKSSYNAFVRTDLSLSKSFVGGATNGKRYSVFPGAQNQDAQPIQSPEVQNQTKSAFNDGQDD